MIRKTVLALAAGAALVTAAFAPTAASAGYYGYGYRSYYKPYVYECSYNCYNPSYSYGYKSYGYKSYGYKSYGYGY
jgi:hypothetical protein